MSGKVSGKMSGTMSKLMLRRLRLLFVLIIIVFFLLTGRLAYLQIARHDYYWFRSEENRFTKLTMAAPRGEIFDREGRLLVSNRPGFVLSLMDRGEGYDPDTIAFLAEILEIEEEEIYKAIRGQLYMRYLPLQLQKDITFETIARVSENRWKLKGVAIEAQPIRDYRAGVTAAHLLGYLSRGTASEALQRELREAGFSYRPGDPVGQAGIERTWEAYLKGRDGEQLVETNMLGQPISYYERRDPVPGHNLHLTLDLKLQQAAEDALVRRINTLRENREHRDFVGRASAVVLDVNSGAVLAMANWPSYDPNTITRDFNLLLQDLWKPLNNIAAQGVYPVGSTYKMVTAAAALEEGKFRDRTHIHCTGVITLVGDTKSCFNQNVHGSINVFDALAVSCNIYFYRAGLAVGIDKLAHYSREFGFGSPTGLKDVPGEEKGIVASRESKSAITGGEPWYEAETMSAAIGQTYHSYTPLQLANYTAMIANGGIHYRPYLVDRVTDHAGSTVLQVQPEVLRRAAISPETFAVLREGMRRATAVSPRAGTAWWQFHDLPITVAAKTGSAQVAAVGSGIPAHSLFVGFAPFENPEIAVAVIVEHGGIGATGATPVAREIIEYYFTGTVKGIDR